MEDGEYDTYEAEAFDDDEDVGEVNDDDEIAEEDEEKEGEKVEEVEEEEDLEDLEAEDVDAEVDAEVDADADVEAEVEEEEIEEEDAFEPDEELIKQVAMLGSSATDDYTTDFQKIIDARRKLYDIPDPQKRLTKYEFVAIVGFRAQQIAEGAPPYVTVQEGTDPITIATMEFDRGLIPLMIERPFPANKIGKFKYETYQLDQLLNVLPLK